MMWKVIVLSERFFGIFLANKQGNQAECEAFSVKSNPRPARNTKNKCLTVYSDTHLSVFVKFRSRPLVTKILYF